MRPRSAKSAEVRRASSCDETTQSLDGQGQMPEGPEIRRAADALGRVLTRRALIHVEYRIPRLARKARALRGAKVKRVYTLRQGTPDRVRSRPHALQPQPALRGVGSQRRRAHAGRAAYRARRARDLEAHGHALQRNRHRPPRHAQGGPPPLPGQARPRRARSATTVATMRSAARGPSLRRALAREPAPRPALRRRSRQLPAQRHPVHRGPCARCSAARSHRLAASAIGERNAAPFATKLSHGRRDQRSGAGSRIRPAPALRTKSIAFSSTAAKARRAGRAARRSRARDAGGRGLYRCANVPASRKRSSRGDGSIMKS